MHILFATRDPGPTRALGKVAAAYREIRAQTTEFLLDGKDEAEPTSDTLDIAVQGSDIVVLGMSSPNARFELLAAELAQTHGKPLAVFADTFGAWNREPQTPLREQAKLLFVALGREMAAAKTLYPNAKVIASGNPLWDAFRLPYDRADIRKRLEIDDTTFAGLISGTKGVGINTSLLLGIVDALGRRPLLNARFFFARHPGDQTDPHFYNTLLRDSLFARESNGRIVLLPTSFTSDGAMGGMDCLVHSGTSMTAVHALVKNIPVIDAPVFLADAHVKRENGGWQYTLQHWKATTAPTSTRDMSAFFQGLQANQNLFKDAEHVIPARAPGECAEIIVGALLTLAKERIAA